MERLCLAGKADPASFVERGTLSRGGHGLQFINSNARIGSTMIFGGSSPSKHSANGERTKISIFSFSIPLAVVTNTRFAI